MTTASCSDNNVTADGGAYVTSRGVCWSALQNPTTANPKTTDETGLGSYSSIITGLFPNTTYFVRAYATNAQGTAYGVQKSFKTEPGEVVGTFTDSRDGNEYKTVTIGHQVWMAENLAYLPSVVGPATGSRTEPYYYVYCYDSTDVATAKATVNYKTYGVLYNWPAAMNGAASSSINPSGIQGACPPGWHFPSDAEWTQLETYLANNGHNYDGSMVHESGIIARLLIAKSMANSSGWHTSSNEGAVGNTDYPEYRNKSGFSALPGGYRTTNGDFYNLGEGCYWWSSSEYDTKDAWNRYLSCHNSGVYWSSNYKAHGFSVRCLKN
ncbi:MAG: FISUMP domain-containing protein [Bacteroidales bacterium]|nr:FISUMP domain-containing protein [Bacteroidales bacterium]